MRRLFVSRASEFNAVNWIKRRSIEREPELDLRVFAMHFDYVYRAMSGKPFFDDRHYNPLSHVVVA